MAAPITRDLVWKEIEKRLFAVLSYVNPKGEARSAGVVYVARNQRLYIGTGAGSWKAKHIGRNPNVALNVTIPKRIPFLPWIKIPQATIAFSGKATVFEAADVEREILKALMGRKVDDPRRVAMCFIEVEPTGHFATYGVGVSLLDMQNKEKARGRVAVR